MHGKEQAIARAVRTMLGADVIVPSNINTDLFGTFSGEIERKDTMGETALAKAKLGMTLTGLPYGMASEGTYGAHPIIPFLPGGIELIVFIDQQRGLTITETIIDDAPCFDHMTAKEFGQIDDFLQRIGFPKHGIIIKPNKSSKASIKNFKGITTHAELERVFDACQNISEDHAVLIQTDMRAHYNPTRMNTISKLAKIVCDRLVCHCNTCNSPGFGRRIPAEGLPCSVCGTETSPKPGYYLTCEVCSHKELKIREDGLKAAEPKYCPDCNP